MCRGVQKGGSDNPIIRHGDFSTNFYASTQSVAENQQNLVVSPASVLILLSVFLGSTGPQGRTASQICQAINADDQLCDEKMILKIRHEADTMTRSLESAFVKSSENDSLVRISNAAFMTKMLQIRDTFRTNFERNGLNRFEETDFTSSRAMTDINDWVKKVTDGLIEKIYSSQDELPASTLLVLLNAIYFKDVWEKRFIKFQTKSGIFRSNVKREVQMMKIIERMGYLESEQDGYRLILKNFKNDRFKFIVVLPYKDLDMRTLDAVMYKGLNYSTIETRAIPSFVELNLPQFQLESETELKNPLGSMGIRDLFDPTQSNLSGIIESGGLFVDAAKQNARIEVSEDGVKAAAVTSIQISRTAMPMAQHKFKVDQPFFCIVYDSELKLPLFIARVVEPKPLSSEQARR